ncbi:hypothetical protein BGY98DRAFT_341831 [Russula aff. rugulosa BPL654]|nr:hypothetical protein BGY98DRAFT_341831 [Russula aff. rugulosa BPL654]
MPCEKALLKQARAPQWRVFREDRLGTHPRPNLFIARERGPRWHRRYQRVSERGRIGDRRIQAAGSGRRGAMTQGGLGPGVLRLENAPP